MKFETELVGGRGPSPSSFDSWVTHIVLFSNVVSEPSGLIHAHGSNEAFPHDGAVWSNRGSLSRGLEALWRPRSECDEGQEVSYFAIDEPRLRTVIKPNDDDLSDAQGVSE